MTCEDSDMKKTVVFFLLGLLFSALTFAGVTYVLMSGGIKSPGYAVIPMVFAGVFFQLWRKSKSNADSKVK